MRADTKPRISWIRLDLESVGQMVRRMDWEVEGSSGFGSDGSFTFDEIARVMLRSLLDHLWQGCARQPRWCDELVTVVHRRCSSL